MLSCQVDSANLGMGEITDTIKCTTCGCTLETLRPLVPPIFRVPISAPSLQECISNSLAPQPLEGRICSQCHAHPSEISTQILVAPDAVCIQLLRFDHGTNTSKNTSNVSLARTVQLDGVTWPITGIINHVGTLHQGHYTSFVKSTYRWYRCNDSKLTSIVKKQVN